MQAVAREWTTRRGELSRWALEHLAVRFDAFGAYYRLPDGSVKPTTAHEPLTRARLRRHFSARCTEDVIGLHVASPDEMCRTAEVDIDAHPGDGADPERNLKFALRVLKEACALGLDARLVDSNGKGGYHVIVVFGTIVPMDVSWKLGKYLIHDYEMHGLTRPPESFPKSARHSGKRYGGWVRLPGKHHKRDHWTRVWCPTRKRWLEGAAAISSLLGLRGHGIDPAEVIPSDFVPVVRRYRTVQVAPDGTVAGDPVPDTPGHRLDVRLARRALTFLGREQWDDYDRWLAVGMSLRQLGPDGFELWDEWSRHSRKYVSGETAHKWTTLTPGPEAGGVTLGTLFRLAMDAGWGGPASALEESDPETGIRITISRSGRRGTITFPMRLTPSKARGAQR